MNKNEKLGLLFTYLQFLFNVLIGFIYTPLLISFLGIEEYGLYIVLGSFVGYIAITDFGLHSTITRFISKFNNENNYIEKKTFLGSVILLYSIIISLVLISSYGLSFLLPNFIPNYNNVENKVIILYAILVFNICISLPLGLFPSYIEGLGLFAITRLGKVGQLLLRTTLIIFLLFFFPDFGIIGIALLDTSLNLIFGFIFFYLSIFKYKFEFSFSSLRISYIFSILKYSWYIFILAIVNQFFWKLGQVILGLYNSLNHIAVFSIAILLVNYVMQLTSTFSQLMIPKVTSFTNPYNLIKINNLFINVGKFQFFVFSLIFFSFSLLGKDFLLLWLNSDFNSIYYYVLILLFSISLQTIMTIGTSLLKALNYHSYQAYVYLLSAILFVILSYVFSKNFGAYGVSISSVISIFIVQSGLMMIIFYFKLRLNILNILSKIIFPFIIPILITYTFFYLFNFSTDNSWITFLLNLTLIIVIYSISSFYFSLGIKDRSSLLIILTSFK